MDTTTRRSFFARMAASLAGGSVVAASLSANAAAATGETVQKVVYHLSDMDKVSFVLGNIKNHIAGKGGPDKVKIVLVVHGPPLMGFVSGRADPKVETQTAAAMTNGVSFVACGNTMKAQDVSLEQLPQGFEVAAEGGVVRIADLQAEGYLYIRP